MVSAILRRGRAVVAQVYGQNLIIGAIMSGEKCQEIAVEIFKRICDGIEGPLVVTVAVTHNESPGIGKTSVGVAASWDITRRERREVFKFIVASVDDGHS